MHTHVHRALAAVIAGALAIILARGIAAEGQSPVSTTRGQSLTLDLSYQAVPSDNDPWHHLALTWQALVRQKTGGRIQIRLYPGGQLSGGNQQKEIELLQNGSIQAAIFPSSTLTVIDPRLQVVGLPWIVPTPDAATRVIEGPLGQQTADWLRAKGMEPIALGSNGFRQLANRKRAVLAPGDLEGLKIRVPGSQVLVDTWKALGAEPTVVNFAELYTALQQGAVDGEELPFVYKLSTKFYEVEKYATRINYSFDLIYVVVSKKVWDSVPAADQELLRSTAVLAAKEERAFLDNGETRVVNELQSHGMQVTILTLAQIKPFQAKVRPVYDEFAPAIGKNIIRQWLKSSGR